MWILGCVGEFCEDEWSGVFESDFLVVLSVSRCLDGDDVRGSFEVLVV